MPFSSSLKSVAAHLEFKVASYTIDSLGRRWDAAKHPRDSRGRFIETGGIARVGLGGLGTVIRSMLGGKVEVEMGDGSRRVVPSQQLTMVRRPNGMKPTASVKKVAAEDARREEDPSRGDGKFAADAGDDKPFDGVDDDVLANPEANDLDYDADNPDDSADDDADATDAPEAYTPTRDKAKKGDLVALTRKDKDGEPVHVIGKVDTVGKDGRPEQVTLAGEKNRRVNLTDFKVDDYTVVPFEDVEDAHALLGDATDDDGEPARLDNELATDLVEGHTKQSKARPAATARPKGAEGGGKTARPVVTDEDLRRANTSRGEDPAGIFYRDRKVGTIEKMPHTDPAKAADGENMWKVTDAWGRKIKRPASDSDTALKQLAKALNTPPERKQDKPAPAPMADVVPEVAPAPEAPVVPVPEAVAPEVAPKPQGLPRGTRKEHGLASGDRAFVADAIGTVRPGTVRVADDGVASFEPDDDRVQSFELGRTGQKFSARKIDTPAARQDASAEARQQQAPAAPQQPVAAPATAPAPQANADSPEVAAIKKAREVMTGPELVAAQDQHANGSPEWNALEVQRQKLVRDAMRSHPDRQAAPAAPATPVEVTGPKGESLEQMTNWLNDREMPHSNIPADIAAIYTREHAKWRKAEGINAPEAGDEPSDALFATPRVPEERTRPLIVGDAAPEKKPSLRESLAADGDFETTGPFDNFERNEVYETLKSAGQQKAVRDLTPEQQDVYFESRKLNRPHTAAVADAKKSDSLRTPIKAERPSDTPETAYPENNIPEGATPDEPVRADSPELLGDVPARADGGAGRPDDVLPAVGAAGGGADRGRAEDSSDAAAGSDGPGTGAGVRSDSEGGAGDGAGRPGVPAAGAGDRDEAAVRVDAPRVGERAGDAAGDRGDRGGVAAAAETPARAQATASYAPTSQADLAESGPKAKLAGNLAAIRLLKTLEREGRTANASEQKVLAKWAGWGALPKVFTEADDTYAAERAELKELLSPAEYNAAHTNIINAHYTDLDLVKPVWKALAALGFKGGNVLEPGSGSGNFISQAVKGAKMTGVELDPTTAAIARNLYPDADIHTESFGDAPFRNDSFDAVIGNVPFGNVPLYNSRTKKKYRNIHNGFIQKSLDHLKPGGVMAVVTSSYTLDGSDKTDREAMFKHADLIGAVRLPNGAHKAAADTDVATDVLIFRKRKAGETPGDATWLGATPAVGKDGQPLMGVGQNAKQLNLSDYYTANPDNVLGELGGGYNGLSVKGDGKHVAALDKRLAAIAAAAKKDGKTFDAENPGDTSVSLRDSGDAREGRVRFAGVTKDAKGKDVAAFERIENGRAETFDLGGAARAPQFKALLELRDLAEHLFDLETTVDDDLDPGMEAARSALRTAYWKYRKDFGPIGSYELADRTKKVKDAETGEVYEEKVPYAKFPAVMGKFRQDIGSAKVFALEKGFDPEDPDATRAADVLESRQVQAVASARTTTDSPIDAVTLAGERPGGLTIDGIAAVLGTDIKDAREQVRGLVFDDPDNDGRILARADYLTGNVRTKWKRATEAAETDPRFQENADELAAVMPPAAVLEDLDLTLGSSATTPDVVRKFAEQMMGGGPDIPIGFDGQKWTVDTPTRGYRNRMLESAEWGTADRSFYKLLELVLNGQHRIITIKRKNEDGEGYWIDKKAGEAATAKAQELEQEFIDWVYANPDVAKQIAETYTDKHRSLVPRNYDGSAERAYEGMTHHIKLKQHQNDAVTRAVNEESVLLEHVVGSGKTFTLAATAMELRRLGLARKPVLVVPGPMIAQWTSEIQELYPNAKILAADSEATSKENRARFAAMTANNDWDIVVMTRESFESVPVSKDGTRAYVQREIDLLNSYLARAEAARAVAGKGKQTGREKDLIKKIEAKKTKLKAQLDARKDDDGISFESLGFDYVMVDEAHAYKNLDFTTGLQGVTSPQGANRARDMHMKIDVLRESKPNDGTARVAAFATGTPISNSLAEMYTMTRFLRPDLLAEVDLQDFDAWAQTFAKMEAKQEQNTAANGWTERVRMRGFKDSLGDALRIWRSFSDTKTIEDLPYIKRPALKGGERKLHVVPQSEAMQIVLASLAQRVQDLPTGKPEKGDDTHVAIIGDGRRAAIDPRLISARGLNVSGIDPNEEMESPKVEQAAAQILETWRNHAEDRFTLTHDSDEEADLPGALQMVFIDSDSPKGDGRFSSYQLLKDTLIAGGMAPDSIRFIQEAAGNKQKKAQMMEDARQGRISVLVGNTESLGTGTNAQNRLVALHHVDASWKPSDIEQREGRALRQGNQYPEVEIHAYLTERSHDVKTWDMISYKQAGLNAIQQGSFDMKGVEFADDVDPLKDFDTLVGAGLNDPLFNDRGEVAGDLKKLRNLSKSHARRVSNARAVVQQEPIKRKGFQRRRDLLNKAKEMFKPTAGDDFSISLVDGGSYYNPSSINLDNRHDAAEKLTEKIEAMLDQNGFMRGQFGYGVILGELGGLHLRAETGEFGMVGKRVRLSFLTEKSPYGDHSMVPGAYIDVSVGEIRENMTGVLTRLENRVAGLDATLEKIDREEGVLNGDVERAQTSLNAPFRQQEALNLAEQRGQLLDKIFGDAREEGETDDALRAQYATVADQAHAVASRRPSGSDQGEGGTPVAAPRPKPTPPAPTTPARPSPQERAQAAREGRTLAPRTAEPKPEKPQSVTAAAVAEQLGLPDPAEVDGDLRDGTEFPVTEQEMEVVVKPAAKEAFAATYEREATDSPADEAWVDETAESIREAVDNGAVDASWRPETEAAQADVEDEADADEPSMRITPDAEVVDEPAAEVTEAPSADDTETVLAEDMPSTDGLGGGDEPPADLPVAQDGAEEPTEEPAAADPLDTMPGTAAAQLDSVVEDLIAFNGDEDEIRAAEKYRNREDLTADDLNLLADAAEQASDVIAEDRTNEHSEDEADAAMDAALRLREAAKAKRQSAPEAPEAPEAAEPAAETVSGDKLAVGDRILFMDGRPAQVTGIRGSGDGHFATTVVTTDNDGQEWVRTITTAAYNTFERTDEPLRHEANKPADDDETMTVSAEDMPAPPEVSDADVAEVHEQADRDAITEARTAAEEEAHESGATKAEVELAGDVAAADEATKDAEVAAERPVAPEVAEPKTPRQLADEDYPLSEQQQPIADLAVADREDVLVEAKAGAGKTSTLVAIAKRFRDMAPDVRIGYIAFNKSVQKEAQGRFPKNTETRTGHSVSFAWAGKKFTDARFKNPNALRNSGEIARHLGITKPLGDGTVSDNARDVMRAVGMYANSADDKISEKHFVTADGRDLLAGFTGADKVRMQEFAVKAWKDLTANEGRLNTNNDHIRKMWALSKPDFSKPGSGLAKPVEVLFLDEAQDTPPVLAKVIEDQTIQKIIVGDGDQAIYGFTGAIDFLAQAKSDNRLPLTKSYRFGPQVADWGNRFLQVLGSKQRVVGGGPDSAIVEKMDAPDAILTRSNGGMFDAILGEQEGGRTVGVPTGTKADLRNLIGSARYLRDGGNAPQGGMHEDIAPFNTWQEFKNAVEKGDDQKLTSLDRLFSRYDMGQLYDIVENLIEEGDNGLDGVNVDTDDARMTLSGGGTGKMTAKLKAETGSGVGQFGFRWNGDDKSWTLTGDKAKQDAALARLKEALGGDARKPDVTVSTAHKAKGLEWARVRIGDDFRGPEENKATGELEMPDPEELRLAYVAVTRAEKELDLGSLGWVRDYSSPNGEAADAAPVTPETIDAPEAPEVEEPITLTADDLVADDVAVPEATQAPQVIDAPLTEAQRTFEVTQDPREPEAGESVALGSTTDTYNRHQRVYDGQIIVVQHPETGTEVRGVVSSQKRGEFGAVLDIFNRDSGDRFKITLPFGTPVLSYTEHQPHSSQYSRGSLAKKGDLTGVINGWEETLRALERDPGAPEGYAATMREAIAAGKDEMVRREGIDSILERATVREDGYLETGDGYVPPQAGSGHYSTDLREWGGKDTVWEVELNDGEILSGVRARKGKKDDTGEHFIDADGNVLAPYTVSVLSARVLEGDVVSPGAYADVADVPDGARVASMVGQDRVEGRLDKSGDQPVIVTDDNERINVEAAGVAPLWRTVGENADAEDRNLDGTPVVAENREDDEEERKRRIERERGKRYDPSPSPSLDAPDGGGGGLPTPVAGADIGELPLNGDPDASGSAAGAGDEDRIASDGRRLGDLTAEELAAELNTNLRATQTAHSSDDTDEVDRLAEQGDAIYRVAERRRPESVLAQSEANAAERHPDFGNRIGETFLRATPAGHMLMENVGDRRGNPVERVLWRIEKRDGVWGAYPPTEQSPASFMAGTRGEALSWAEDRANGLPDPEDAGFDAPEAPAAETGERPAWNGGNPSNLPPAGSPIPVSPALSGELAYFLENGEQDGNDQGYTLSPNGKLMLVHNKAKALSALDAIEDIQGDKARDRTPGAAAIAKAAGARKQMVNNLPDPAPTASQDTSASTDAPAAPEVQHAAFGKADPDGLNVGDRVSGTLASSGEPGELTVESVNPDGGRVRITGTRPDGTRDHISIPSGYQVEQIGQRADADELAWERALPDAPRAEVVNGEPVMDDSVNLMPGDVIDHNVQGRRGKWRIVSRETGNGLFDKFKVVRAGQDGDANPQIVNIAKKRPVRVTGRAPETPEAIADREADNAEASQLSDADRAMIDSLFADGPTLSPEEAEAQVAEAAVETDAPAADVTPDVTPDVIPEEDYRPELLADGTLTNPQGLEAPTEADGNYSPAQVQFLADEVAEVLVNVDGSDEWMPGIFERIKDGVATFRWSGTTDSEHGRRHEWPVESIAGIRGVSRLRTVAEEVDPSVLRPGTEVAVIGKSDKGTYRGVLEGVTDDGRPSVRLPDGTVRNGAVRGTVRPVLSGFRPGDEPTAEDRLLAPTPGVWTANGEGLVSGVRGEWVAGIQPTDEGYEFSLVGFDNGREEPLFSGNVFTVEAAKEGLEDAFYMLGMNGRDFSTLPGDNDQDRDDRSRRFAGELGAYRGSNETPEGPSDGASEESASPADVDGAPAEWVPTGEIAPGDVVRVDGDNGNGSATTRTGHALGTPEQVTVGGGGGKPEKGLRTPVGNDTDGLGNRETVLSPESSLTARVSRTGSDADGDNPQTAYESQVLADNVGDTMPLDAAGVGIFPGSWVEGPNGNVGTVLGVWDRDVEVRWPGDSDSERIAPGHLTVTPNGQARPHGWTRQGHRLAAGHMVALDGDEPGVVQSVSGDEAQVQVGDDTRTIGVEDLQVIGKVSDATTDATAAPAYDVPPSIEGPDVRPSAPMQPADLPEGVPASRVILKPEDRATLENLGLDTDSITPMEVQEAAARVRHDMPLTAQQAMDLAVFLGSLAESDRTAASSRSLKRLENRLTSASQRAGKMPERIAPQKAELVKVSDLTRGDLVALPNHATGEVDAGTLFGFWPIQNGQIMLAVLETPDGSLTRHHLLPDGEAFLLPDFDTDLGTLDPDGDVAVKFVQPQVADRAAEAATLVVEAAVGDSDAASIEDLANEAVERMDSDTAGRGQRNSGRRNKASMERSGLTPEQVEQGRTAAETAADEVAEKVTETVLNTLEDAEPLPGESNAQAADRVRDLVRDADADVDLDAIVEAAMADRADVPTREEQTAARRAMQDALRADLFAMADQLAELGDVDSANALSDVAAKLAGKPDERHVQAAVQAAAMGRPNVAARMTARIRGMFSRARAAFARRVAAIHSTMDRAKRSMRAAVMAARAEWNGTPEVSQVLGEAVEQISNAAAAATAPVEPLAFAERVAYWRDQLPGDSSLFGKVDTPSRGFRGLTLARLRGGDTLNAEDLTGSRLDRAADGGPGKTAQAHYEALRGLGAAMDDEIHARVRGLAPELGEDPAGTVRDALLYLANAMEAGRIGGDDAELIALERKALDDAIEKQQAYSTAKAKATLAALAQVRPMGPQAAVGLNVQGRGADAPEVQALHWAEQFIPTEWLAKAGSVEAQAGRMGSYNDGTITVAPLGEGMVEGSGKYGASALRGLAHHLEASVPGLAAASWAHHWAQTSTGEAGARQRRGKNALAWLRDVFPAAGFSDEDGAARWAWDAMETEGVDHYQWLGSGLEDLFGDAMKDDDLRQWMLGLLAYLARKG